MPRKRLKSKQKLTIKYKKLTWQPYEAICKKNSMSEMFGEYKSLGFEYGYYFAMFDKNDPKACAEIWNFHKEEVMEKWRLETWTAGTRPFLWWIVEAPEPKIKVKRIVKYFKYPDGSIIYAGTGNLEGEKIEEETEREYLERLNLLEPWEIKKLKEG